MKFAALSLIFILPLLACSAICPKLSTPEIATVANNATVALIFPPLGNLPFCSGVWISKTRILLADHCIDGLLHAVNTLLGDEIDETIGFTPPVLGAKDINVPYVVQNEVIDIGKPTTAIHYSSIEYQDKDADLAILLALKPETIPAHGIVNLARKIPIVGDSVYISGHENGLYYTFRQGIVSSYRNVVNVNDKDNGPWMQVSAPIGHGDSGAGLLNSNGELVGIASFISNPDSPDVVFFVPLTTIRTTMEAYSKQKK